MESRSALVRVPERKRKKGVGEEENWGRGIRNAEKL